MNVVLTLFYFILALFLLVTVHEFGHFIVARWCGVKVLRFSFGFGKVLASWSDRHGTEFAWSLFPLGGYVKMLDEEEGPVASADKHLAFNNQSVWAKIAIAFAGPLFNFLFAFLALWLVWIVGIQSLAPIVDKVLPGSIAAQANLKAQEEIIAFNQHPISSWRDFQYVLMPLMGSTDSVPITVKSMKSGQQSVLMLPLADWKYNGKTPDVLATLGIQPFTPTIPPVVGEVVGESPAAVAGIKTGDEIISVDGKTVTDWLNLLNIIQKNPGQLISIVVKREGNNISLPVKIGIADRHGQSVGLLGVHSKPVNWPSGWLRTHREGPVKALGLAFRQTYELTAASFSLIGRLATGKVSLQGISGPVGIAQGAGESARGGFSYYMSFLALISISLGVLNLLPVPLLDGGHLLYYFMELIRRRPLSPEFKSAGMYFGFVLLMALMVLALTNDIGRLTDGYK